MRHISLGYTLPEQHRRLSAATFQGYSIAPSGWSPSLHWGLVNTHVSNNEAAPRLSPYYTKVFSSARSSAGPLVIAEASMLLHVSTSPTSWPAMGPSSRLGAVQSISGSDNS